MTWGSDCSMCGRKDCGRVNGDDCQGRSAARQDKAETYEKFLEKHRAEASDAALRAYRLGYRKAREDALGELHRLEMIELKRIWGRRWMARTWYESVKDVLSHEPGSDLSLPRRST